MKNKNEKNNNDEVAEQTDEILTKNDSGAGAVKAISYVLIITMAGKLLGLLRDRLLAVNYGTGMYSNAFLTASRIPRVFFDVLFASAIAASFIPVFSSVMKKKGRDGAVRFGGNFVTVIGAVTLAITVVGIILSPQLVQLFAGGYDKETAELSVSLTRIMFPTIFFTGIAYSFVGILQSFDEFNIPAFISVLSNLIIIGYYIFLIDDYGIYGLAVAFLVGWSMQAIIQIPSLKKKQFKFHFNLSVKNEEMKQVFALMLPVMVSTWVQPINLTINSRFASDLYAGSGVSAIEYSTNLYYIIIGVFILSVTNVIFPRLSRMSADKDSDSFNSTLRTTMHASMFFVIPMMLGLMALSRELIDLVYGGGEFGADDVDMTSKALFFVSLGMIGYAVQNILSKAYFAAMDGKTPLVAGIFSIAVNVLLCFALVGRFGISGLALSASAASIINAVVLDIVLERRHEGFITAKFCLDMLKMTVASLVMAVSVKLTAGFLAGMFAGIVGKLVVLLVPTLIGIIIYFVLAIIFKIDESYIFLNAVKRKKGDV